MKEMRMKKWISLLICALLLISAAAARTEDPLPSGFDLYCPADGSYAAAFTREDLLPDETGRINLCLVLYTCDTAQPVLWGDAILTLSYDVVYTDGRSKQPVQGDEAVAETILTGPHDEFPMAGTTVIVAGGEIVSITRGKSR